MVSTQLLDALPIGAVFILFAIVAMAFYEGGFRLGRWWQNREPGEQEGPTGVLVGSILALLAFLLAVTMGMASDRFDTRRAIVLAEANSIGTTYLRAGYLPEPASARSASCSAGTCRSASSSPRSGDIEADIKKSGSDPLPAVDHHRGRRQDDQPGRPCLDVRRVHQRDDRSA